jgi:arylsulfatase A-like enzyme
LNAVIATTDRRRQPALVIAAVAALFAFSAAGAVAADTRPNVLFIAVDDWNDWNSVLGGHEGVKTPNLERIAARGTVFTRAYCSAPACNPSRASLLSGRRPSTSGVYHNNQPWRPAMPGAVTLPQHFMANGYRVEGGGKIFHGSFPERAAWHDYCRARGDARPPERPANGISGTGHFDWGPIESDDSETRDARVVDWGAEFLARDHEKPFFLAVGLHKPHLPWYVPKKYFDLYPLEKIVLPKVLEGDLDDVPAVGRRFARTRDHESVVATNNWKKAVQGYLASISFADAQLGRLLDALDAGPHARDTIVVFWSDHGWHLGQKQHWRKFALWEHATRVNFIVAAPGVSKPASRCARTVSLLDVYPTLAELCGLPMRGDLEGTSLLPLLRDPETAWDKPAVTTHGQNNHAVRSERWRYIRYADGGEELYDEEVDPLEWKNLAGSPEHLEAKQSLAKWLPATNAPPAPTAKGRRAGEE